MVVRDTQAMIASMEPVLVPGDVVFSSTSDAEALSAALPRARSVFAEPEGVSLILPIGAAKELGLEASAPMRQITLQVLSALDGVGLTAAVASALAADAIPSNFVAARHHDHVFVPAAMAERAMEVLRATQERARQQR